MSTTPQNNKGLNQGILHLWSKFGDPGLNGSQVIARICSGLTHGWRRVDGYADRQTQATAIPEGQNRPPVTRQIWGIWKLRPAYSPETPNLGQNRWCFVPCDLQIWWMSLENNRASLLCCFKLCATFHSHRWIHTGVTVRKRPIWVKFDDF